MLARMNSGARAPSGTIKSCDTSQGYQHYIGEALEVPEGGQQSSSHPHGVNFVVAVSVYVPMGDNGFAIGTSSGQGEGESAEDRVTSVGCAVESSANAPEHP